MNVTFNIIDRTTHKTIIVSRFCQNVSAILKALNKNNPNRYYYVIVKKNNNGEVIDEKTDWL